MVSKSLISTTLAGFALAAAASAQTSAADFGKVDGPLGKVHYDLATGKVTKVVRPRQVAGQTNIAPQSGAGDRPSATPSRRATSRAVALAPSGSTGRPRTPASRS